MANKEIDLKLEYEKYLSAYCKAYKKEKSRVQCVKEVSAKWKILKVEDNFPRNVDEEIANIRKEFSQRKNNLTSFWTGLPKKQKEKETTEGIVVIQTTEASSQSSEFGCESRPADSDTSSPQSSKIKARVQDQVVKEINDLKILIADLSKKIETEVQLKELKDARKLIEEKEKYLRELKANQARQKRSRDKLKRTLEKHPETATLLKKRSTIWRPRVEDDQPGLLDASFPVVNIETYMSNPWEGDDV